MSESLHHLERMRDSRKLQGFEIGKGLSVTWWQFLVPFMIFSLRQHFFCFYKNLLIRIKDEVWANSFPSHLSVKYQSQDESHRLMPINYQHRDQFNSIKHKAEVCVGHIGLLTPGELALDVSIPVVYNLLGSSVRSIISPTSTTISIYM